MAIIKVIMLSAGGGGDMECVGLAVLSDVFLNSSTPSSLTSRSTTNKLFLDPVGSPVLKRFGLISVFFWLV